MNNVSEILKASGRLAEVAGQITGQQLNFSSKEWCSVKNLHDLLVELEAAVIKYNNLIVEDTNERN
jgi:hypothetical protein